MRLKIFPVFLCLAVLSSSAQAAARSSPFYYDPVEESGVFPSALLSAFGAVISFAAALPLGTRSPAARRASVALGISFLANGYWKFANRPWQFKRDVEGFFHDVGIFKIQDAEDLARANPPPLDLDRSRKRLRDLEDAPDPTVSLSFATMPESTETDMGKAWPILKKAPKGFYVSVGGERSFRGAAMADASGLVVADVSASVLRYARINRELLHAQTLNDYLHLRLYGTYDDWQKFQSQYQPRMMLSSDDHHWFASQLYNSLGGLWSGQPEKVLKHLAAEDQPGGWGECCREWERSGAPGTSLAQKTGHEVGVYQYSEELYARLHALALKDRIFVVGVNVAQKESVTQLVRLIGKEKERVGVLDINNLYAGSYLARGTANFMSAFEPVMDARSVVLVMEVMDASTCRRAHDYIGFRYGFLKRWAKEFDLGSYMNPVHEFHFPTRMFGRLIEAGERVYSPCSWHHYFTGR